MYTIIGLGNPGEKYQGTRHNVGQIVLDVFMERHGFPSMQKSNPANATYAWNDVAGKRVDVFYPETFMNLSGQTAKHVIEKHDADSSHLIVVHDDVNLPLGSIRVSFGRGDGGHNGVSSVIKAIKTKDFIRIRIGVAQKSFFGGTKKHVGAGLSHFVLKKFSGREKKALDEVGDKVEKAISLIIGKGVETAMQECNAN